MSRFAARCYSSTDGPFLQSSIQHRWETSYGRGKGLIPDDIGAIFRPTNKHDEDWHLNERNIPSCVSRSTATHSIQVWRRLQFLSVFLRPLGTFIHWQGPSCIIIFCSFHAHAKFVLIASSMALRERKTMWVLLNVWRDFVSDEAALTRGSVLVTVPFF